MVFAISREAFMLKSELLSPDREDNKKINIIRNIDRARGIRAIFLFIIFLLLPLLRK